MVDASKTREAFASITGIPPLTDHLLQRPPFKFIHDVVTQTIKNTGVFNELFTSDDLDHSVAGKDKTSKISFLEKLIDSLNIDGSLDDVKPVKIVAGKDPEYTNLLLQKLGEEASKSTKPKMSKSRSKSKEKSEKKEKKKSKTTDEESKTKKKSSESEKKTKKKSKEDETKTKKKSTDDESKTKKKKKKSDKEKSEKRKKSRQDEIINDDVTTKTYEERESSGGTSKGGDDSGIAEETGAESELHDVEANANKSQNTTHSEAENLNKNDSVVFTEPKRIEEEGEPVLRRPTTAAVRPQTSMGRPGTSIARPAPPKIKKTKVADLDTNVISEQTPIVDKSILFKEETKDSVEKQDDDDFIIEEEIIPTTTVGESIAELAESDNHGQLVNKIIQNTKKIENEVSGYLEPSKFYDLNEQRKMKAEVEATQRALQSTAQTITPLGRSLDFISEDLELMLKEIDDNRKLAVQHREAYKNKVSVQENDISSMSAMLRTLDNDIKDVKAQISRTISRIIENEKKFYF